MLRDSGSNFLSGSIAPLKGRPQCRQLLSLPSFVRCGSGHPGEELFGVIAWRRGRATGSIAAGTWGVDLRWGAQCRALSPDFPAAALAVFIPWRGAAGFDRRSGWHPRCWGVGSRAAPAIFFLVLLPGGAVELPGRSRPAPGVSTFAGGLNVELSLPIFRLPRSRSLSLGEGLPDSTGAPDGTRAAGVLDRGRRRQFSFWCYCLAARSSYRVDRGRHLGCRPSLGGSMSSSLSRFSGCRARGLYPLARGCRIRPALRMAPALLGCWIAGGAGNFLFGVIAWRRGRATGSIAAGTWGVDLRWGAQCRALSPDFPAAALAVFIPWRGAAGFDRRSGWHPRCWGVGSRAAPAIFFLVLLPGGAVELPGRSRPAPGVSTFAGGLNVELSLPIFRLPRSRSLSLGEGLPDSTGAPDGTRAAGVLDRGRRRQFSFWCYCLAARSSYRVDRGRHLGCRPSLGGSMSSSLSRFSGCRARGLYPLARGCRIRPALRMAPALLGCWIAGGAGNFLFGVIAWRRGRATGSIAAGTWGVDLRWGAQCRALSPDFPAAALAVFIPWRGAAGFDRRSGWHPRCWGVGSRAAPAIFFLVLLPGGAVELPGRSRPAPGVSTFAGGLNVELSLPIFRLPRSRSLSLGEGLPDSTGAPDGTRAAGVLDRGRRRQFSFWCYCLAARSSYRVDRGRHLGCRPSLGGQCRALSPDFPAAALAVFIPWRGAAGFDRRSGWHPRCWGVGSRAAPAIFFLVLLPGGAVELPGRSRPAPGVSTFAGGLNVELSLPIFRLPRSRSLSLGEGLPDSTGAPDGTRAAGVLDRGRRRQFSFWCYCLAARSSYRVDRGRHLGCRPSLGGSMSSSLSRFSGCRARGLYPLARGCRIRPALRMAPALLGCWIAGGAGNFLFGVIAWRRGRATGSIAAGTWGVDLRWGAQCRALSPDFPAAALAVFIPWRGAAGFDRRSGWHPRCWGVGSRAAPAIFFLVLLPGGAVELPGRSRPAPGVSTFAGGLNVELSLPIFRLPRSRSLSLGEGLPDSTGAPDGTRAAGVLDRGRRRQFSFWCYCLAARSSYRVDRGRHLGCRPSLGGSMSSSLSRFSGCRARGLYPLARGCRIRPALRMAPALLGCWIAGGAGNFLFGVIAWRRGRATGSIAAGTWGVDLRWGAQCRALSPDFPAAALAVFIPWRGAAGFDRRSGWHPRCWGVGSRAAPASNKGKQGDC